MYQSDRDNHQRKYLFTFTTHRKLGEGGGVLRVGSIPVAILPSCQDVKILHYNCINMHQARY